MNAGYQKNKIIFFDIDGTLLEKTGTISESTKNALKAARKNGNSLCIASGRLKENLPEAIKEFDWDGMVLGSGMYAEYKNKVIVEEQLSVEHLFIFLDYIQQEEGIEIVLEGNDNSYVTESGQRKFYDYIIKTGYFKDLESIDKMFFNQFKVVEDLRDIKDVKKMMYFSNGNMETVQAMIDKFKGIYEFAPNSIGLQNSMESGEILKWGITKATGIEEMISHAGFTKEDVVAFGDGYNDIEMLEMAGVGVAMGNAVQKLKDVADIVTDTQANDGIHNAMITLRLI